MLFLSPRVTTTSFAIVYLLKKRKYICSSEFWVLSERLSYEMCIWSKWCNVTCWHFSSYLIPILTVLENGFNQCLFLFNWPWMFVSYLDLLKIEKKLGTGKIRVLLKLLHQLLRHSANLSTITIWKQWHNFLPVSPMFTNGFSQRQVLLIRPSSVYPVWFKFR